MGRFLRMAFVACSFLAFGGTVAWATGVTSFGFVGSDGSITACVHNANGNVRFIDPSSATKELNSCGNSESQVVLNQKGQKGDPGPQGPPGPSAAIVAGGYGPSVPLAIAADGTSDPHATNPIARIDLPPGNFALTVKAEFHNASDVTVVIGCFLEPVDQGKITIPPGGVSIMPFVGTYSSSIASEVDLQCLSYGGAAQLNHIPHSVAIQVGSITQN